ncbi:DEAD/DEAH box helicase [Ectothiorhodospira lacustris]|uniref:DEAD/DEAH box helicase n=1 Tax=Ectothiorhodospira lacustris TaxID=2899127 RepID=UPI001EE8EAD1|nr:AAA domain-containing protein [Ectothiorhodospira lacustris]MCG5502043.1 AAA domain-containing protein [Ectothiorhodospira lacustris]
MPFPVIAVFVGISVTATCAAFIFNEMTEKERAHQNKLRDRIDGLQAERESLSAASEAERKVWWAQKATNYKSILLAELKRLDDEHRPLFAEIQGLQGLIKSELQKPNLSRLRRETLRSDELVVEDALCRYQAHADYRAYFQQKVYQLASHQAHKELLDLPLPAFSLPAEWLYVGKVVRLNAATELGHPLAFGQVLQLTGEKRREGRTDQYQRQLLADYPQSDAVPIQVIQADRKNSRRFYGCVARGRFFEEHHWTHEPVKMTIEKRAAGGYRGHLFNGSLPVFLPHQALDEPGINLPVGGIIDVWLKSHDLCLKQAPLAEGFSAPWVTNRAPAALNPHHQRLSLLVSEKTRGFDLLVDRQPDLEGWQLVEWNPQQQSARIRQHDLCLTVHPDARNSTFLVASIETQAQPDLNGIMLPFALELVDAVLADDPYIASPDSFNRLMFLAQQLLLVPEAQARRQQQADFMARWLAVLDYQQTTNEHTLDLRAAPVAGEGREWRLPLTSEALLVSDEQGSLSLDEWLDELGRFKQEENGYQLELTVWKALGREETPSRWRRMAWTTSRHCNLLLESSTNGFSLCFTPPANALGQSLSSGQEERWQLRLSKRDNSLQRQRQALDAFIRDELVAPDLKEMLLMPEYLSTQPDAFWQQRVAQGLSWQNSQLTPTQKQVIETCLTAPHLALVQGPPGTAKTTCIVELLHQLFSARADLRVLVVSQQNAAVDNALSRFIKTGGLDNGRLHLLRLGLASKVQPKLQAFTLENRMTATFDAWQAAAQKAVFTCQSSEETDLLYQWQQRLQQLRQKAQPEKGERSEPDAEVAEMLLNGHNLVGATCVGLASWYLGMNRLTFDLAIIDEAGRATVPELLIPLLRSRKAILIGDHHQLPPTVAPLLREECSREALPFLDETFLENSFFEQLFHNLQDTHKARLKEQYRMVSPIGDLVAELFYTEDGERQLFNGQCTKRAASDLALPALKWVNVKGRHRQGRQGKSLENPIEAAVLAEFLRKQSGGNKLKQPIDVAVITPYRAQVRMIEKKLRKQGAQGNSHRELQLGQLTIKVDTVDSFQGSEASLVCYSAVRTFGRLDFVLDKKRLNVACSRAQNHLVFFGDQSYLTKEQHGQTNKVNYFEKIHRCCMNC